MTLRKRLAVSLGVGGAVVVLSGITLSFYVSSGAPEKPPVPVAEESEQKLPPRPVRSAPAKGLDVADPCSIIQLEQARSLGMDNAPYLHNSNGKLGCSYDRGVGFDGFKVFVAADKNRTMSEFYESQGSAVEQVDFAGYPTARKATNATNCILVIDISDHGSLVVNTLVGHGDPNPTELSEKFAKIALDNLPNA